MDNAFLKGLEQIKKVSPKLVVETIFELFHSVGTMDVEELVAAKRTLDLFRSLTVIDEPEKKIIDQIDESMIVRAEVLFQEYSSTPEDTRIPLRSAFGDKYYRERISK